MTDASERLIEQVLSSPEIDDIVCNLVPAFMLSSYSRMNGMMAIVSRVMENQVETMIKKITELNMAPNWMLMAEDARAKGSSGNAEFACMVPVCRILFPDGRCSSPNPAFISYYNRFATLFFSKDVFQWERDRPWADHFGYTEYLQMFEAEYKKVHEEATASGDAAVPVNAQGHVVRERKSRKTVTTPDPEHSTKEPT